MKHSSNDYAMLVLSDGTLLEGKPFGFRDTVFGEIVFNTGITGYQEVLTDPSYHGQLITFTYPELGNTGVNLDDQESQSPHVRGVVARQIIHSPSNWRSKENLEDWFSREKVVGICGVDTRALVRHLREFGTMNAAISTDRQFSPYELLERVKSAPVMQGLNLAKKVSTRKPYKWSSNTSVDFDKRLRAKPSKPFQVVAIDFGIKKSILNRLVAFGCEVEVLPASSAFSQVKGLSPEGVFLSNGPGDPAAVKEGILLAEKLINETDTPVFGICLGHQILGLALGAKTYKLPYGHRGLNHPCGSTGQIEITSQNHGFAIEASSLNSRLVAITHLNLNDKTVAGIAMLNKPVFGIQYHPEASPGPHDADHHFARFVALMSERR